MASVGGYRFIHHFATTAAPLPDLIKKNVCTTLNRQGIMKSFFFIILKITLCKDLYLLALIWRRNLIFRSYSRVKTGLCCLHPAIIPPHHSRNDRFEMKPQRCQHRKGKSVIETIRYNLGGWHFILEMNPRML